MLIIGLDELLHVGFTVCDAVCVLSINMIRHAVLMPRLMCNQGQGHGMTFNLLNAYLKVYTLGGRFDII